MKGELEKRKKGKWFARWSTIVIGGPKSPERPYAELLVLSNPLFFLGRSLGRLEAWKGTKKGRKEDSRRRGGCG